MPYFVYKRFNVFCGLNTYTEGINTRYTISWNLSNKNPYTICPTGWAHNVTADVYAIIFPISSSGVFCWIMDTAKIEKILIAACIPQKVATITAYLAITPDGKNRRRFKCPKNREYHQQRTDHYNSIVPGQKDHRA